MLNKSFKIAFATALVGLCVQANAGEGRESDVKSEAKLRTLLSYELADVKSSEELKNYLKRAGNSSPLDKLSPIAKTRFIESLSFNQNGLSQYRYDDLQNELNATGIYKVLRIFGAEQSAPFLQKARIENEIDGGIVALRMMEDHENARCVSHGTCQTGWVGYICTSNC